MKTFPLRLVVLLVALVSVPFANAADPCAALAGLYQGKCVTHWPDGHDYDSSQTVRVRQRTVDGATNGRQLMYGEHCASVSVLRFMGGAPADFEVLDQQDFQLRELDRGSDQKTVVDGGETRQVRAFWSADRARFFVKVNTMGEVDGMGTMTSAHLFSYRLAENDPNSLLIEDRSVNREAAVTQSCVLSRAKASY